MLKLMKLGVYVAAGYGTYHILRKYGLLQKAGLWLSEQVPGEYIDQAQQYGGQLRERAQQYTGQLRETAGQYGERASQLAHSATDAVRSATGYGGAAAGAAGGSAQDAGLSQQGGVNGPTANGHTGGAQNISGPGRGTTTQVDEGTGIHAAHTVGRGVVR